MRKPFVAGNWKMNGSKEQNQALVTEVVNLSRNLTNVDIAICPPYVYLESVKQLVGNSAIQLGAQNLADVAADGAFTGEISVRMLQDVGCDLVLIGHSERRTLYNESDEIVAQKVAVALDQGLTPVLCVGETLAEREGGITEQVVATQINAVMDKVGVAGFNKIVIAYEPVWAIGTGMTATPEQAQEVHAFIRALVAKQDSAVAEKLIIQYGGSMNPSNALELLSQPDIDGGLIGGASLKAEDFIAVCQAASEACSK